MEGTWDFADSPLQQGERVQWLPSPCLSALACPSSQLSGTVMCQGAGRERERSLGTSGAVLSVRQPAVCSDFTSHFHLLPCCRPPCTLILFWLFLLSCPSHHPTSSLPAHLLPAPPFPGCLVQPHSPRGPSVSPSASAASRMASQAGASAGTVATPAQLWRHVAFGVFPLGASGALRGSSELTPSPAMVGSVPSTCPPQQPCPAVVLVQGAQAVLLKPGSWVVTPCACPLLRFPGLTSTCTVPGGVSSAIYIPALQVDRGGQHFPSEQQPLLPAL